MAVARKTIPVLIDEAAEIGPIRTASYAPSASQELAEAVSESRGFFPSAPSIVGPVGLQDIVKYSFRAGIVFVSLVYPLILGKFHR